MQTEPNKKGILSLIGMMVLIVLVVAFLNPIYQAFSGGGGMVYTSVQQGYGGEVKVTLQVKEGTIQQIFAEGASETPGIGQKAITQFNETIFAGLSGLQVSDVEGELDAVSGATVTSGAVRAGFQEVLQQAQEAGNGIE